MCHPETKLCFELVLNFMTDSNAIKIAMELRRFFSRLCSEAMHFGADRVDYTVSGNKGQVAINKTGRAFKVVQLPLGWESPALKWIEANSAGNAVGPKLVRIRSGNQLITGEAEIGEHSFSIVNLSAQPLSVALAELGFEDHDRAGIERALAKKSGVVGLVFTPEEAKINQQLLASVVGACAVIDLLDPNSQIWLKQAATEIVCAIIHADSIAAATKKLIQGGASLDSMNFLGFISKEKGKLVWRTPMGSRIEPKALAQQNAATNPETKINSRVPSKLSVVLVEDDPDQREIITMMLKGEGYDVECGANGVEGLEIVNRLRPALVVTDLMMPTMDGAELIRRLKSDSNLKGIPVFVLTVIDDEAREFELLKLGAGDYCVKSTQPKVLIQRIKNLIGR